MHLKFTATLKFQPISPLSCSICLTLHRYQTVKKGPSRVVPQGSTQSAFLPPPIHPLSCPIPIRREIGQILFIGPRAWEISDASDGQCPFSDDKIGTIRIKDVGDLQFSIVGGNSEWWDEKHVKMKFIAKTFHLYIRAEQNLSLNDTSVHR